MKTAYRIFLADQFRSYRKSKRKTQQQMAELLGLKHRAYQAYEEARAEASVFTIKSFCEIVKVKVDKFLKGSPQKTEAIPPKKD